MTHELIMLGDCVEVMRALPDASVDAVITDPPYGLEFMGKEWDGSDGFRRSLNPADVDRPNVFGRASARGPEFRAGALYREWTEAWAAECLRLLKPGGHLLAFGGTRTNHRLASGIEDAGFEIRDTLAWLYGSGFPKSLDVSKAIDKAAGATRSEVIGSKLGRPGMTKDGSNQSFDGSPNTYGGGVLATDVLAAATPEAETWQGWGTALKPAHEPITLARKPLTGTVAANVLRHGTGALNIDACRIEHGADVDLEREQRQHADTSGMRGIGEGGYASDHSQPLYAPGGRWPANVILSHHPDCTPTGETRSVKSDGHHPAKRGAGGLSTSGHAGQEALDERYADGEAVEVWECHADCAVRLLDEQSGTLHSQDPATRRSRSKVQGVTEFGTGASIEYADKGGASRFYYTAKASKRERGEGNTHPTVKPLALMRYLVRLIAPPGALILDPFLGSGTTALACIAEGVEWVGIEQDAGYAEIATERISAYEVQLGIEL